MLTKKNLFIVTLVILTMAFSLVLSGCQNSNQTAPAAQEPTAEAVVATEAEAPAKEPVMVEDTAVAATAEPVAEKPTVETAVEEPTAEPVTDKPTVEAAAEETVAEPATDKPTVEATTEEAAAKPVADEPTVAAAAEEPTAEETAADSAVAEEKAADPNVVAIVDSDKITLDDFVMGAKFTRMQYLNYYYQMASYYSMYGLSIDTVNEQFEPMMGEEGKLDIGQAALNQLVYDKLLEKEAAAQGIEITDEQVTEQLKTMFGYEEDTGTEEDSSMLGLEESTVSGAEPEKKDDSADFDSFLNETLSTNFADFTKDFFVNYAKHSLMEKQLFDKVLEGREFKAEMVSARHILVKDEETAKEVKAKLDAGEDWNALASEYSIDDSNKDKGGDLGWFSRGEMAQPFEEAAFALEPGQISDPVKSDFGYHIIASDGKEVRDLEDDALSTAQDAVYKEWREGLNSKYDVETFDTWQNSIPMEPAFEPIIIPTVEPTTEGEAAATEEPAAETSDVAEKKEPAAAEEATVVTEEPATAAKETVVETTVVEEEPVVTEEAAAAESMKATKK